MDIAWEDGWAQRLTDEYLEENTIIKDWASLVQKPIMDFCLHGQEDVFTRSLCSHFAYASKTDLSVQFYQSKDIWLILQWHKNDSEQADQDLDNKSKIFTHGVWV